MGEACQGRHGVARLGRVRPARQGMAGLVRIGVARTGRSRWDLARRGAAGHGRQAEDGKAR